MHLCRRHTAIAVVQQAPSTASHGPCTAVCRRRREGTHSETSKRHAMCGPRIRFATTPALPGRTHRHTQGCNTQECIGAALSQVGLVSQDTGQTPAVLASSTQPGHGALANTCAVACRHFRLVKQSRKRATQKPNEQQLQATQGRSHPLHRLLHACESGLSREGGTRRGKAHTLAVQRSTTEHPSARGALPTHEGT